MNRANRLKEILLDGEAHCSFDLWPTLKTAPMRCAHELRKELQGTDMELQTVDMHTHKNEFGDAHYAVYQLKREPAQLSFL